MLHKKNLEKVGSSKSAARWRRLELPVRPFVSFLWEENRMGYAENHPILSGIARH
jgi:hypothetical protein